MNAHNNNMRKNALICLAGAVVILSLACGRKSASQTETPRNIDLAALRAASEFRGEIVFQSDMDGNNEIYALTSDRLRKLTDASWSSEFPKWSPDGKRIAFSANPGGRYQIFVMNADGSDVRQVTRAEHDAIEQAWFPDGKRIAFTEQRRTGLDRSYTLWSIDLETQMLERLIPEFSDSSGLPEFSPAAPLLAFTGKKLLGWDVFVYDLKSKTITQVTRGGNACRPHFSPDGRKIAFVSSQADGKGDIWIMNPDGSGQDRLTDLPDTFDYYPSWSADGRTIVFASGTEHYPYQGQWSLSLVDVASKKIKPLFSSGAHDVFPDWH
jgi:Tol biopolymer transport system component